MNLEEMRALSDADLATEIQNQHEEWRNLRFQNALGRLTQYHQISTVRKSIAQLKTIQREREIAADPLGHLAKTTKIRARRRREKQDEKLAKRRYARAQAARKSRRRQ
ncbi:MAG: 50S ribosomal protein L29 [Thermomicrobiales bacterium]|jgi:large subunit ribosomal protein L29|nr:50S ribosomal protein L29 [Thermomicrobiales bacterium]